MSLCNKFLEQGRKLRHWRAFFGLNHAIHHHHPTHRKDQVEEEHQILDHGGRTPHFGKNAHTVYKNKPAHTQCSRKTENSSRTGGGRATGAVVPRLWTSTLGNQFRRVVAFDGCHRLRTTWFVTNFVLCARSHRFLLPSQFGSGTVRRLRPWRIPKGKRETFEVSSEVGFCGGPQKCHGEMSRTIAR